MNPVLALSITNFALNPLLYILISNLIVPFVLNIRAENLQSENLMNVHMKHQTEVESPPLFKDDITIVFALVTKCLQLFAAAA